MATLKIKKGDTVKVIAGKDNGKEGKVTAVDKKNSKVTIEGVNMITKHAKPSQANSEGGILQKEAPMNISNVMYVHKGKATRIGFKVEGDKKVRFAKSTGEVID
ncbi:MAG TPA: 50S ribosomal protein L24 [Lachnospiraceae bacterium]|nr:50S ribosomal protein L24 [Lachnospiraceae bacterium]